ncbi:MAG: hypothetical protein GHCLOJNM_01979 [bacterium]|nr:hypothetical protein [bacterium]
MDSKVTLDTVRAMARGGLAIPEEFVTRVGRDGKHYSLYGPLLPVVSLPGYFLGCLLDKDPPEPGEPRMGWGDRFALATNQWVSAGIVTLLFLTALEFGAGARAALLLAGLSAVSTMIFPYSRDYFTQPLAALMLLAAFHALLSFGRRERRRLLFASSTAMGCALLTRLDMAAALSGLLWIGVAVQRCPRDGAGQRGVKLAPLLGPMLACALALLLFDWVRWGGLFGAPYGTQRFDTPLIDSVPKLLFGADLSVFLYNPLLIASGIAMSFTWREKRHLWVGILLSALAYLYIVAKYNDYHGGLCPGPRYLLSLVPLSLAPLGEALAQRRPHRPYVFFGIVVLATPGILINGYSAVVDYTQAPAAWYFWVGKVAEILSNR